MTCNRRRAVRECVKLKPQRPLRDTKHVNGTLECMFAEFAAEVRF